MLPIQEEGLRVSLTDVLHMCITDPMLFLLENNQFNGYFLKPGLAFLLSYRPRMYSIGTFN